MTKQCSNCTNWNSKHKIEYGFKYIEKSIISECTSKSNQADPKEYGKNCPVHEERKE